MKQLDQRVSKLERAMVERPPNLKGKSAEQCLELYRRLAPICMTFVDDGKGEAHRIGT